MQPEEVDTEIPVPLARPVEYEFVEEEPMHKKAGYEDASMFFGHCTEAACFFSNGTARACIRIGGQTTRGTVRYSNDRSSSRQKPCKAKDVLVRVPNHPLTTVLETHAKLGGGFKHFVFLTPTWGNDPIWRSYFSDGLKPPTSKCLNTGTSWCALISGLWRELEFWRWKKWAFCYYVEKILGLRMCVFHYIIGDGVMKYMFSKPNTLGFHCPTMGYISTAMTAKHPWNLSQTKPNPIFLFNVQFL